jgi:hypothetical protein
MAERDGQSRDRQTATAVMMIRPLAFARNEVTRPTNRFQHSDADIDAADAATAAVGEFTELVELLIENGVRVRAFPGRDNGSLPDEVFPNNWLSTHDDGTVVLYPMMAWNRRAERRRDILEALQQRADGFRIERIVDLSDLELKGHFLEGTGSMVLDRVNRMTYTCLSPRSHIEALRAFAKALEYDVYAFDARDEAGHAIFHTNVFMSLGSKFAVVCLSAIAEIEERYRMLSRLERSGREVIDISFAQLRSFAANLLELATPNGTLIAISATALASLREDQRSMLGRHGRIVAADISTIERLGGGSVRCMLAELFLPRKSQSSQPARAG